MKKVLVMLCISALLFSQTVVLPTAAAEPDVPVTMVTEDASITAVGLIKGYSLSASNSSGKLCINGSTVAEDTMQSIGFTDIVVERSSNGTSGWSTAYNMGEVLNTNVARCDFNNKLVTVTSGYYYRVTCNHYAKETGWFFPKSQSVGNTSNAVYIG